MIRLITLALSLLLAACGGSEAPGGDAAGLVDTSFEAKGLPLAPAAVMDVLELRDGSLLLAGSSGFLAKLKADGTLETSFAGGGVDSTRRGTATTQSTVQLAPHPPGAITVIEIHSSFCVGGFCDDFIGDVVARRINESGVVDPAYGVAGIAKLRAARGSVVVSTSGRVTAYSKRPTPYRSYFQVQSLDAAGNVDAAFADRAYEAVRSCRGRVLPFDDPEPQSVTAKALEDKTLVAAWWPGSGLCLVRLDAQGALDETFAAGGQRGIRLDQLPVARPPLLAVIARADGQIVVVMASRVQIQGVSQALVPAFLFFTQNGDLDSMTSLPDGVPPFIVDALTQSNGKLVSAGYPVADAGGTATPQLWRSFPAVNAHDPSFGPFAEGYSAIASGSRVVLPQKMALDRAGRILVAGSDAATGQPTVVRFR